MKKLAVYSLIYLCAAIDYIPIYAKVDGKRQWICGCLGCYIGLASLGFRLEEKWKINDQHCS